MVDASTAYDKGATSALCLGTRALAALRARGVDHSGLDSAASVTAEWTVEYAPNLHR